MVVKLRFLEGGGEELEDSVGEVVSVVAACSNRELSLERVHLMLPATQAGFILITENKLTQVHPLS